MNKDIKRLAFKENLKGFGSRVGGYAVMGTWVLGCGGVMAAATASGLTPVAAGAMVAAGAGAVPIAFKSLNMAIHHETNALALKTFGQVNEIAEKLKEQNHPNPFAGALKQRIEVLGKNRSPDQPLNMEKLFGRYTDYFDRAKEIFAAKGITAYDKGLETLSSITKTAYEKHKGIDPFEAVQTEPTIAISGRNGTTKVVPGVQLAPEVPLAQASAMSLEGFQQHIAGLGGRSAFVDGLAQAAMADGVITPEEMKPFDEILNYDKRRTASVEPPALPTTRDDKELA